jgi:hypothetical protein
MLSFYSFRLRTSNKKIRNPTLKMPLEQIPLALGGRVPGQRATDGPPEGTRNVFEFCHEQKITV